MFLFNHIIFNEKSLTERSETIALAYPKGRFEKLVKSGGVSIQQIFSSFVVNSKLRKQASGQNG